MKAGLKFLGPVCILLAIGLGSILYRTQVLSVPFFVSPETEAWKLGATLTFEATGGRANVSLAIPRTTSRFQIVDERFQSNDFSVGTFEENGERRAVWLSKAPPEGKTQLHYEAIVRKNTKEFESSRPLTEAPIRWSREKRKASKALVSEVRSGLSADGSFVPALLKELRNTDNKHSFKLLRSHSPSDRSVSRALESTLIISGIPARSVRGVSLSRDERTVQFSYWLEVLKEDRWRLLDISTARWKKPYSAVPWLVGDASLLSGSGITNESVRISVTAYESQGIQSHTLTSGPLIHSPLHQLPLETQAVYRIVLMMPFAALVVVVLRSIIGIKMFGTFMPVLIALAFRETNLLWGIAFFVLIVFLGLLARLYFNRLKLLLVPRLAATLTVTIIIIALVSLFTFSSGQSQGLSVALFPFVIIAMVIERMSILWDELGPQEALVNGMNSLIGAAGAYFVLTWRELQYVAFVFPESLLVLLAVFIMLGRYSGYRLTELRRFRTLVPRVRS